MKLEKLVEYSELFELYGDLFSDKMKKIFSCYYISDLTLSEIAANEGISRQAVLDVIHQCEKKLTKFENSIGFAKYRHDVDELLLKVQNGTKEVAIEEIKKFKGEN